MPNLTEQEISKLDSIELVNYQNEWPNIAAHEIVFLKSVLPMQHILDIQHVGSTAIPGMIAKPIIDIQIAVDSLSAIKPLAIDILQAHQYVYWAENPDPERMFFVKGMPPFGKKRTHHVHIYEPTCRHWREKILFRDYLIAHPETAQEYMALKKILAQKHTFDREKYTAAKTDFINAILAKAEN